MSINKKDLYLSDDILGNLTIFDVLVTLDYPRVFVCEDDFGCKYLFSEFMSGENFDKWVVQKISKTRYNDIKTHKISLQKSFEKSEQKEYFIVTENYDNGKTEVKKSKDLPKNSFTKSELFIGGKSENKEDLHKILDASKQINSAIVDIVLLPNQKIEDIEVDLFTDICSKFANFVKDLNGKKNREKIRVSTKKGSFVIRFNMNDQINLFDHSSSNYIVEKINKLFSSDNYDDIVDTLKSKPKSLDTYTKFLKVLDDAKLPIQIATARPNDSEPVITNLSVSETKTKYESIRDIYKNKTKNLELKGVFISVDLKYKSFRFKDIDNKEYNGKISANILAETYEVHGQQYDVIIQETTKVDEEEITKKISYTLISLQVNKE